MRAFIALGIFLAIVLAGQVALVCVAMGMKWDRVCSVENLENPLYKRFNGFCETSKVARFNGH